VCVCETVYKAPGTRDTVLKTTEPCSSACNEVRDRHIRGIVNYFEAMSLKIPHKMYKSTWKCNESFERIKDFRNLPGVGIHIVADFGTQETCSLCQIMPLSAPERLHNY
jgi:hypothetical protein